MSQSLQTKARSTVPNYLTTDKAAIAAAIAKLQDWRITRATERTDGIPAGLPYLTGWVQHFAVTAAMEEPQ